MKTGRTCQIVIASFFLLWASAAFAGTTIPFRPLIGMDGLDKAIQIQKETGSPIILFSFWEPCPNSNRVRGWFESDEACNALRNYPRVILVAESRNNSYHQEIRELKRLGINSDGFVACPNYDFKTWFYTSPYYSRRTFEMKKTSKMINDIEKLVVKAHNWQKRNPSAVAPSRRNQPQAYNNKNTQTDGEANKGFSWDGKRLKLNPLEFFKK